MNFLRPASILGGLVAVAMLSVTAPSVSAQSGSRNVVPVPANSIAPAVVSPSSSITPSQTILTSPAYTPSSVYRVAPRVYPLNWNNRGNWRRSGVPLNPFRRSYRPWWGGRFYGGNCGGY